MAPAHPQLLVTNQHGQKGKKLCKSPKNFSSLRETCLSPDATSYPAEPFSIAFNDDILDRKTAVTSLLDREELAVWG